MAPLPEEVAIDLALDEPTDSDHLRVRVAERLGVEKERVPTPVLRKRSIDARRGSVRFHLVLGLADERPRDFGAPHPRPVDDAARIVIVGDGPAGLFCAYELARRGIGSTIVERGKPVQPRRRDLKGLNRHGRVDPNSNYCFGEGGAGTYSDGKLYTRSHKRGAVRDIIEILFRHGAPEAILTDARPHIGSNRLPGVVSSIRRELEGAGVRFRFESRMTDLCIRQKPGMRRCAGIRLAGGEELGADHVVLATGHGAADVYLMLAEAGVMLEPKAFAVGLRVEHPQPLIDRIQYGRAAGHPQLPSAAYRLSATIDGRGVFSFCMCPGGWIVPASTEPEGLVVNGMSLSKRDSPFANAGLVVSVSEEELVRWSPKDPRAGVELQRRLERRAFEMGGGALRAPATRLTDFVARRGSTTVPRSSYVPGLRAADVAEIFSWSGLGIEQRVRSAVQLFDQKMRNFLTEEAVLVGVETRTSSPVRIPRHPESFESPSLGGLYPVGEGAGYAGGIMSAAMDGVRVAQKIAALVG